VTSGWRVLFRLVADLGRSPTGLPDPVGSSRRVDTFSASRSLAPEEKTDLLFEIHRAEEENYKLSLGIVGPEGLVLVQLLQQLFLELTEKESAAELPEQDNISVTHFLVECRTRLFHAVLSILRGHLSNSAIHTRRAIESVAFLVAMRKKPELFQTWMTAPDDEERERE